MTATEWLPRIAIVLLGLLVLVLVLSLFGRSVSG